MKLTFDKLTVNIDSSRVAMGQKAAKAVIEMIHQLLNEKESISIVFAAAPSQLEFLTALTADKSIPWERINAFHMDEYIGLNADAPQLFAHFLDQYIFKKVPFRKVYYMNGQAANQQQECIRYAELLLAQPIDIACIGIGENGHIAFNDPHVADFNDPKPMKVVDLDLICREQQVNDGCFETLTAVPNYAYTLTIPTLLSAAHIYCIVPGDTKAKAVRNALLGPISETCPASILRRMQNTTMYLDARSAAQLNIK